MLGISLQGVYSALWPWPITQTLTPAQFKAGLERNHGTLIDVRTYDEFIVEHIDGAINIDIQRHDFKERLDNMINKNNPCYVYCKAGKRSEQAMKIMSADGFDEVYNLQGGIEAWKQAGYPVIKSSLQIACPRGCDRWK